MVNFVWVKPAEGGRVRMPDRGSTVMPAEGMFVPRNDYYERLIQTKDLEVDVTKKFEPPKPAAPEPAPAEKSENSRAARK